MKSWDANRIITRPKPGTYHQPPDYFDNPKGSSRLKLKDQLDRHAKEEVIVYNQDEAEDEDKGATGGELPDTKAETDQQNSSTPMQTIDEKNEDKEN